MINRQVQHMAVLLDYLLDISRITRGTMQLRLELTEIVAVVDAAVEMARPRTQIRRNRGRIAIVVRAMRKTCLAPEAGIEA